jgi:peptidoglycan/LPS O-acetylase OafA/YrhL
MVANWYFLQTFDYFAPAAERQPLLHVWSLAVEEQYHLVVPALVLGLAKVTRRTRVNLYRAGLACAAPILISPDWSRAGVNPNTVPTDFDFRKRAGTSTEAR